MASGELPGVKANRKSLRLFEILYTPIEPAVSLGHVLSADLKRFCGLGTSGLEWSSLSRHVFCFIDCADGEHRYVSLSDILDNPHIASSVETFIEASRSLDDFRRTLRRNALGFSRPREKDEYLAKKRIVEMLREGYHEKFGRYVKTKGYLLSVDLPVIELDETVETIYQRKDVNWEHLLMPQRWETASKLMEVRTIIPDTGFGAYREWWVRDQICSWSKELGLIKGKDFDIGIYPGTCVEGIIPDSERTKTKYPDFAYIFPLDQWNILFFVEVGGDSGYYMVPEIESSLRGKYRVENARAGFQKTHRLFDNETGGWNFNRGWRIMDNVPKIASLRTFDAPIFYVYVCDLFNAIPMKKDDRLQRQDIVVPVFDESTKSFFPTKRIHTSYTYEQEMPIVHAFYLEANDFVEKATHFFGKKYGTRIGRQGRTMEPKIQIDLRQHKAVRFFKTGFHTESFKHVLKNVLDLYHDFKTSR
jgi:hypothetical protein